MSKNWVDMSLALNNTEDLNDKLRPFKYMMQEVPKQSRYKKYDNTHKVYEKNEFVVLKLHNRNEVGFIVYNTKKKWEGGHTHLNSFNMAKTVISNVIQQKKPKTNNVYLMRSHIRISNDDNYVRYIEDLITTRRSKSRCS